MKKQSDLKWFIIIATLLILLSLSIYSIQIYAFHREVETFFYFFQDLSFVPIQVLFVTFVIDRLMQRKEKITLMKKVYVAVGIFFNEAGNELLRQLLLITPENDKLKEILNITTAWKKSDFDKAEKKISNTAISIEFNVDSVESLKHFLLSKKMFILDLLENSNLAEHDSFTDTMLAFSHVIDELSLRESLNNLPRADIEHLKIDIKRVYVNIIHEWILYMNHIKNEYPFLFSLAMRSNPFKDSKSVVLYD